MKEICILCHLSATELVEEWIAHVTSAGCNQEPSLSSLEEFERKVSRKLMQHKLALVWVVVDGTCFSVYSFWTCTSSTKQLWYPANLILKLFPQEREAFLCYGVSNRWKSIKLINWYWLVLVNQWWIESLQTISQWGWKNSASEVGWSRSMNLRAGEPEDIVCDASFHPLVISLLQISQGGWEN